MTIDEINKLVRSEIEYAIKVWNWNIEFMKTWKPSEFNKNSDVK